MVGYLLSPNRFWSVVSCALGSVQCVLVCFFESPGPPALGPRSAAICFLPPATCHPSSRRGYAPTWLGTCFHQTVSGAWAAARWARVHASSSVFSEVLAPRPSALGQPPSVICHLSPVTRPLPSVTCCHLPPVTWHPPPVICHRLLVRCALGSVQCVLESFVGGSCPPRPAARGQLRPIGHRPPATCHLPSVISPLLSVSWHLLLVGPTYAPRPP